MAANAGRAIYKIVRAIASRAARPVPKSAPLPIPKPVAIPIPRTDTKIQDRTCKSETNRDCKKQKHSGRIQAQEGNDNFFSAAATGSAWSDLPKPPNLVVCTGFATSCRTALKAFEGKDRGGKFQADADVAYANLVKWMEKTSPAGVSAYGRTFKKYFYFSGVSEREGVKARGKASRRMDFDVLKGEALKG